MAQSERDSADLAVASFPQDDLQHTGLGSPFQKFHLGRARDRPVENDSASPLIELLGIGQASHRDPVSLAVVIPGMGQFQRELPLVAQKQGASAVCIQPADGVQAFSQIRRYELEHGSTSLWVPAAADHSRWFVQ